MKPIKTLAKNQLSIETYNKLIFQSYDIIVCEIKDTLFTIDIEIANTKDITAKASLIASKVKLLEILVSNSGKNK